MSEQDGITFSFKVKISKGLLEDLMKSVSPKKEATYCCGYSDCVGAFFCPLAKKEEEPKPAPETSKSESPKAETETPKPETTVQPSSNLKMESTPTKDTVKPASPNEAINGIVNIFSKVLSGGTITQDDTVKVLSAVVNASQSTNATNDDKWLKDLAKQVLDHEPPYTG